MQCRHRSIWQRAIWQWAIWQREIWQREIWPKPRSCRHSILQLSRLGVLSTPVLLTLILFASPAHAADISFLNPHGPIAAAQRTHFFNVILLMLIVVLPVLVGTPLIAWRYRYGNTAARYTPNWGHSWQLETLIWGGPVAIVAVMGIWLAHGTTTLDPYRPLASKVAPLKVDVVGYDWKWLFIYPQLHIASVGQLVFPEHRSLSLTLTSDSVMESFLIPALGSQIYAMAAMTTHLHLMAASTGQFLGENTQYDGTGFQDQKFIARATTPQGFRDWVANVKARGVPLSAHAYSVLRRDNTVPQIRAALQASQMPPGAVYFDEVHPTLFANVVRSFHGGPTSSVAMVRGPTMLARNATPTLHRNEDKTTRTE